MPENLVVHTPTSVDVTIVIVSYNTRELTLNCLHSIYEQTKNISFEVIVVDNASSDDSTEAIKKTFPKVSLVENPKNLGFAAANNQGIRQAKGRYVLLLNSDTRVLEGAIDKSVGFADSHPEAGVVGCRTLSPDGSLQYNCFMFPSLLNLVISMTRLSKGFSKNRFFGRVRLTWWDYDTVREVDVVAGCFMLVRRQALDEVGPMTEEYFMYSEDTDWCWRFHRHGWKVLYTPEPSILHVWGASSSQCFLEMKILERRSFLIFLGKKSGKLARWAANMIFFIGSLLRISLLGFRRLQRRQARESVNRQWNQAFLSLKFHFEEFCGQTGKCTPFLEFKNR